MRASDAKFIGGVIEVLAVVGIILFSVWVALRFS
jgi:hypothetical protein